MENCFRSPIIKYLRKSFPFVRDFDRHIYSSLLKNPGCEVPDNMKEFLISLLDEEFEYDRYAKKYFAIRLHDRDIVQIYLLFLKNKSTEDILELKRESIIEILEVYSRRVVDLRDYQKCDELFNKACKLFIESFGMTSGK